MIKIAIVLAATLFLSACSTFKQETRLPGLFSGGGVSVKRFFNQSSAKDGVGCRIESEEQAAYVHPVELNIWDRIREGFALPNDINKRTQIELDWYTLHPSYIDRVSTRAQRYLFHVVEELENRNLPMELALLPIVESAYDPFAYSHGRAAGMWQVIPGTAKMLGLKQNWWYDGRRDVVASTDAALNYLESLAKQFDGDWLLALAAYNSGAGNVSKAIRKNVSNGKPTDYWSLELHKETESYVPKLLALRAIVFDPDLFNVTLCPIANEPMFELVNVESQLDLAQAADMAQLSMREFYMYNPGYNRWATDPEGPHHLAVPSESAEIFKEALAKLPKDQRVTWDRHRIKPGDTLSAIATQYRTTTTLLQSINGLKGNSIRAGQTLLVPRASKATEHYVLSASQRLVNKQGQGKGKREVYVVKSGDSLWSIGKKLGVSSGNLAKWNGLAPHDPIRPGQKLVAWQKGGKTVAQNDSTTRKLSYRVRKGDSLARIADKFDVRIADIVDWNRVNPKKYLQPGDSLTLFVDVTNVQ